jgi:four helix bundle protein
MAAKNNIEPIGDRLLRFCVGIINLVEKLPNTQIGQHIRLQLFRASSSAGANYEEACAGESRADFVHKMQVVLKESRESRFWLKLICAAELIKGPEPQELLSEAHELCLILGQSVVTAKRNR